MIRNIINNYIAILFIFSGICFAEEAKSELPSCTIVIFGASGDLTAKKLLPAIHHIDQQNLLSHKTAVVGFAKSPYDNEAFRDEMRSAVKNSTGQVLSTELAKRIFYHSSDFTSDEGYRELKKLLSKIDAQCGTKGNRIFYLATAPSFFATIIEKLHEHQLIVDPAKTQDTWSRVVIEKPFGHDLNSAEGLQKTISKYLDDSQVYRMDHYLGKEGVQNLLTLRFENALLEPIWNNKYIDNVQITLAEDIGIGSRAAFWEETGALKDLFQNHLMQLLAIIAMEPPAELSATALREEKIKVLESLRPLTSNDVESNIVRAQYTAGTVRGSFVVGYKDEKDVPSTSCADTFVAAKMFVDNPRWKGVPFYVRGGKRLAKQTTEIIVTFKSNPLSLSKEQNALYIRVQPDSAVYFKTISKAPGIVNNNTSHLYGYSLNQTKGSQPAEAYEKLLYDCISGDQSLFVAAEEQIAAWKYLMPVIECWKSQPKNHLKSYDAGTWGPEDANTLLGEYGHKWHTLEPVQIL